MARRRAPVRRRRCWHGSVAGAWVCLCWLGCTRSPLLDLQIERIGQLLLDADANGALRCAPRQLAVARSQLEFAELELAQGFASKARQHLIVADQHARAAVLLSPPDRCRPLPALSNDGPKP